jgi:alkylhydroperoxidase family enzyme
VTTAPRLTFDELPASLRTRLNARVERLGYLGEFFRIAAHQPDPLGHFIDFTESLKSALDWRLVEVIALTVASKTGNQYELVQHQRLASKLGMDGATIALLSGGSPEATVSLDENASVVRRLAAAVVDARGRSCDAAYARVEQRLGHEVAIGCLMTATRYLAHATMANTWQLEPPVPAPAELRELING